MNVLSSFDQRSSSRLMQIYELLRKALWMQGNHLCVLPGNLSLLTNQHMCRVGRCLGDSSTNPIRIRRMLVHAHFSDCTFEIKSCLDIESPLKGLLQMMKQNPRTRACPKCLCKAPELSSGLSEIGLLWARHKTTPQQTIGLLKNHRGHESDHQAQVETIMKAPR